MPQARLTFAIIGLMFLGACQRQPGPAPVAAPAADATSAATAANEAVVDRVDDPVVDPVAGTDAVAAIDRAPVAGAGGTFDVKAFSGTFAGTLPCASCPGIDAVLEIRADGRFVLTETYRDEAGPPVVTQGSWSLEQDDSRVLLDPDGKGDRDRRFAIAAGHDRLQMLDLQGNPPASELDYTLARTPASR